MKTLTSDTKTAIVNETITQAGFLTTPHSADRCIDGRCRDIVETLLTETVGDTAETRIENGWTEWHLDYAPGTEESLTMKFRKVTLDIIEAVYEELASRQAFVINDCRKETLVRDVYVAAQRCGDVDVAMKTALKGKRLGKGVDRAAALKAIRADVDDIIARNADIRERIERAAKATANPAPKPKAKRTATPKRATGTRRKAKTQTRQKTRQPNTGIGARIINSDDMLKSLHNGEWPF